MCAPSPIAPIEQRAEFADGDHHREMAGRLGELARFTRSPGIRRELVDLAKRYDRRGEYFELEIASGQISRADVLREVRQRRGRGRDLHSSRVGFGVLCLRRAARRNCSPYCLTIAAGDWLAVHCYDGGHGHDHVTW